MKQIKKLGTILDEVAEWSRRKQLTSFAMSKLRPIWKNRFIPINVKIRIFDACQVHPNIQLLNMGNEPIYSKQGQCIPQEKGKKEQFVELRNDVSSVYIKFQQKKSRGALNWLSQGKE